MAITQEQYVEQLEADLHKAQLLAQHQAAELASATEIIHELRSLANERVNELRQSLCEANERNKGLELSLSLLTAPQRRTVSHGGHSLVRFADFRPLTREQIFQRVYAEASELQDESEEQLARAASLFDNYDGHEFTVPIGRRPMAKGMKLPRPGAWSQTTLAS